MVDAAADICTSHDTKGASSSGFHDASVRKVDARPHLLSTSPRPAPTITGLQCHDSSTIHDLGAFIIIRCTRPRLMRKSRQPRHNIHLTKTSESELPPTPASFPDRIHEEEPSP